MPNPAPVRIAIADDHRIFRDGLTRLLNSEPGFTVVGEAATGSEAISLTRTLRPDVLLLDVAMPDMDGVEALPSIDMDSTKVILLTAAIEPGDLLKAIQRGARGIVMKEAATEQLLAAIHRVMDGKYIIGTDSATDLAGAIRQVASQPAQQFGLTPRELEIVGAIVDGQSNRDIAERLGISLATVKNHLTSVFDKTGTSSRLELALMAMRESLTTSRRSS